MIVEIETKFNVGDSVQVTSDEFRGKAFVVESIDITKFGEGKSNITYHGMVRLHTMWSFSEFEVERSRKDMTGYTYEPKEGDIIEYGGERCLVTEIQRYEDAETRKYMWRLDLECLDEGHEKIFEFRIDEDTQVKVVGHKKKKITFV